MALAPVPESVHEENEDLIHIEVHMKNVYATEGGTIYFEVKTVGQEPICCWFFNGKEVRYSPRFKATNRGLWHKLIISKLRRSDAGLYTVLCRNDFSYSISQALLTITNRRSLEINYKKPHAILYLPWPKSSLRVTRHLQNLRVIPGEPIKMKIQIDKKRHVVPEVSWYKNNRLCFVDDGIQSVADDYTSAEYVKYSAEVEDSGLYTVLVVFYDMVVSSSAEVVVMDPNDCEVPVPNNGSPCFYIHLPEEIEVYENEDIRLACKADVDPDTTVQWSVHVHRLEASERVKIDELENGVIALRILQSNIRDTGVYSVIIKNKKTGNEISSQCIVNVNRLPPIEIPTATVHHPLSVVVTSIGNKVCLYCKFNIKKTNSVFAVWRVGMFRVERCSSQFGIVTNQKGMYVLLIRNIDPDMLGEISCELRYMLPSRRSIPIVITKGLLVNVPSEAMTEESYGEYKIWAKKIHTDMDFEKTTVLYSAERTQLPHDLRGGVDEDEGQDEAAAYPEGTLTPGSPKPMIRYAQLANNDEEELMEFAYCRLAEDFSHFLMILSCHRRKILLITETQPETPDISRNFINIIWINKSGLPPGTLYAIDSYQPSGNYFRAGVTSEPLLIISAANAQNLMLFRVRIIRTYEKTPQCSFIVCPPRANVLMPQILQRLPAEEFARNYTRIGVMGNGAYGTVCLVKDRNQDFFAAKIVKTRTEKRREATRREMDIMENLRHKRIVQLFVAYVSREQCILVMEYLWGGELFERIVEEDNFKECTAVHYVRQICEGLEYLHGQKIVHLDIKPENVVCISPNSRDIKIVDFGLSKILDKHIVRAIYGTRDYIAPEVLSFEAITTASDMWSLGVVTYLMLSGTVPFIGANWVERAANITKGAYDFEDSAFDNVTEEAKQFINALLLLDPNERLTAITARQHPWMVEAPKNEVGLGQTKRWRSNLKTYLETNKDRWQTEYLHKEVDDEKNIKEKCRYDLNKRFSCVDP